MKKIAACTLLMTILPWLDGQTTFSAGVKVVTVFATVRDKKGQMVRNLSKDDFVLEEDGRPQQIRYFSQDTDLPLTLGLLVDTSESQRRVLGDERSASSRFLDQVLREEKDKAFVIHFDREVELLQDLTASRKKLEAALAGLETPERPEWGGRGSSGQRGRHGGGTLLYDSVLLASDDLMKKQQGRKALIVLSDGVDRGSKVSLEQAIESAQRADTLVYSLLFKEEQEYRGGFGGGGRGMGRHGGGGSRGPYPENRPDGKKVLQRLSSETGGSFFEVSKKMPVGQIYDRLQEELRSQYSIGYTPDRADAEPGFRKIALTTRQKGVVVQSRGGYYAGR